LRFATSARRGKRDMKYVGKLDRVLFIRVTLTIDQHYILRRFVGRVNDFAAFGILNLFLF
jgi:hypothetical protein